MTNLKDDILKSLSQITFKNGVNFADIASEIIIKNNNVGFSINITNLDLNEAERLREEAILLLSKIDEIGKISIILTSGKNAEKPKTRIDNVKKIILVASGKGGVGKSTMAVSIAENLNARGYKIGIVDADIYGPSIPTMFGIYDKPEVKDGKMLPINARGLQLNSIGFLNDINTPIAWRGPMASKAIYQLLSLTLWENLDYLIIDMPPGTGDIHLAVIGNYNIDGVIIATTPQKLAQIDVIKSIELYKKLQLPILGLIENMSYYIDALGHKIEIFQGDYGKKLSDQYNIPAFYQVPINPKISAACDDGESLLGLVKIPIDRFIKN